MADKEVLYFNGLQFEDLVDDKVEIVELANANEFPAVGEANILYLNKETGELNIWDGTGYDPISGNPNNIKLVRSFKPADLV